MATTEQSNISGINRNKSSPGAVRGTVTASTKSVMTGTTRSVSSSNEGSTKENEDVDLEEGATKEYVDRVLKEDGQPFKDSTAAPTEINSNTNFALLAKNPKDSISPKRRAVVKNKKQQKQQQQQQQKQQQQQQQQQLIAMTPRTDGQDDHLQLDTVSIISQQSSIGSSIVGAHLVDSAGLSSLLYKKPTSSQQHPPQQYPYVMPSSSSISSAGSLPPVNGPMKLSDPDQDEQAMFQQRLCEDDYGVAVRKVASNGKSQMRYVKCVFIRVKEKAYRDANSMRSEDSLSHYNINHPPEGLNQAALSLATGSNQLSAGSRSASSFAGMMKKTKKLKPKSDTGHQILDFSQMQDRYQQALMWGNKKKVKIPLDKFVCVRKGKTTERTRRNTCSSGRLLSIITKDKRNPSLDIEAPTKLDRDKFAKAFSRFLKIPLQEENNTRTDASAASLDILTYHKQIRKHKPKRPISAAHSAPGDTDIQSTRSGSSYSKNSSVCTPQQTQKEKLFCDDLLPAISPSLASTEADLKFVFDAPPPALPELKRSKKPSSSRESSSNSKILTEAAMKRINDKGPTNPTLASTSQVGSMNTSNPKSKRNNKNNSIKVNSAIQLDEPDDDTEVSSLTQGYDQEIVDELHNAINELRAELEASRAEAARAVKVAEQAIQSAESCSSNDWNSTVTHKAAEAAAQAQKRSAEAMARQRLAEERVAAEKKSAMFWRKQAEAAEDEIGALQTRVSVAEVHRAKMAEELGREKSITSTYIQSLKRDYFMGEKIHKETLDGAKERNRLLEIEVDGVRRDLVNKEEEAKGLVDLLEEIKSNGVEVKTPNKKKFFGLQKMKQKQPRGPSLLNSPSNSTSDATNFDGSPSHKIISDTNGESIVKLSAEASLMRKQFELLRRITVEEMRALPEQAKIWADQAARALIVSNNENKKLRTELAVERSHRRRILNEVQDLRGTIRVYCRPKSASGNEESIISTPSNEICLLHREKLLDPNDKTTKPRTPLSFEFDRVFKSGTEQSAIYSEMEELVLSALDGYNVCIMSYGASKTEKMHTMFGDYKVNELNGTNELPNVTIDSDGLQILAAQQLFTIAEHRKERYQDSFTLTIVEVNNEKLRDMIASTKIAEERGQISGYEGRSRSRSHKEKGSDNNSSLAGENSDTKDGKINRLEIRTNYDGDTVVQGLLSITVNSFEDVKKVWSEAIGARLSRCKQQGIDCETHIASSHIIATLQVVSTNIASGVGTVGKIQFVDLAAADIIQQMKPGSSKKSRTVIMNNMLSGRGRNNEWKFANKSITTLSDVIISRSQFTRKVPYRNSTLTHLLRDSLEGDTKVLCLVFISSDKKDIQETACALRVASAMKKVVVGKATKHTVSLA